MCEGLGLSSDGLRTPALWLGVTPAPGLSGSSAVILTSQASSILRADQRLRKLQIRVSVVKGETPFCWERRAASASEGSGRTSLP